MVGLTKEQAALRAAEINATNAAARDAIELVKAEASSAAARSVIDNNAVDQANAALCEARQLHNRLLGQRLVAGARGEDLARERQEISFRAHGGQDNAARQRLSEIHRELAEHDSECASIEAAIAEAERLVSFRKAEAASQAEMQRARETLALVDDLNSAGKECDRALKAFLTSYDRLERVSAAIYRVAGTPSHEIVGALARRALCSALLSHKRVFELEQFAPAARTTFSDMAAAWSRVTRHWCRQRLGGWAPKDKEAA